MSASRAPQKPSCEIDWGRLFSLPLGVPPLSGGAADALWHEYGRALKISGKILVSTFDRFQATAPDSKDVRAVANGGARALLPRLVENLSFSTPQKLTDDEAKSVVSKKKTFSTSAPKPGDATAVEAELQAELHRDAVSQKFTPIPIPFADLDMIRLYFPNQTTSGLTGSLGLTEDGVLLADGTIKAEVPKVLLTTRTDGTSVQLGELDRLILRSPVAGRFRFVPYYLYRWESGTLTPVGPSTTGRLIMEQPDLSTQAATEGTDTRVFQHRLFAFEHVDRAEVAPLIHKSLMLQLRFFKEMSEGFDSVAPAEPRLKIPLKSAEVLGWVTDGLNGLLRSWTSFLSVLRWRPEDIALDGTAEGAIPADWKKLFPSAIVNFKRASAEAKTLLPTVKKILDKAPWLESVRVFSREVYSYLLAGYTWNEVLLRNGRTTDRFPVPNNLPPFNPSQPETAAQHERLRLLENPELRWVACYAGCPIGKPARVYSPTPGGTDFPTDGLTTYEVEAHHVATTAPGILGVTLPSGTAGPRPGQAMSLQPYVDAGKATGYACYFSAQKQGENGVLTVIDFLIELTRGIHFKQKENAFVDLHALEDPATGQGHPLLTVLHADEHRKAVNLRRQMDELSQVKIGTVELEAASVAWWSSKVNMPGVGLTPTKPYLKDRTRPQTFTGVLLFEDLMGAPDGWGLPSGFDVFDLESAYLAQGRMHNPLGTSSKLPIPVILALMETEGVKHFAPVNRHVRSTKVMAETLAWEAHSALLTHARRPPELPTFFPSAADIRARNQWLSFPYGLDFFRTNTDAAVDSTIKASGVAVLDEGESIGEYLRRRTWSEFHVLTAPIAPKGVPQIWKLQRRAHWAALSLMVGFYRHLELNLKAGLGGFAAPDPAWLPAGSSPPSLTGKGPADVEWKDYLSYYGMIYSAYNSNPSTLVAFMTGANTGHSAAGSALSLRDFLLFKHSRGNAIIQRMVRFVIALDAFLRLDLMEGLAPSAHAGVKGKEADPNGRSWGV